MKAMEDRGIENGILSTDLGFRLTYLNYFQAMISGRVYFRSRTEIRRLLCIDLTFPCHPSLVLRFSQPFVSTQKESSEDLPAWIIGLCIDLK